MHRVGELVGDHRLENPRWHQPERGVEPDDAAQRAEAPPAGALGRDPANVGNPRRIWKPRGNLAGDDLGPAVAVDRVRPGSTHQSSCELLDRCFELGLRNAARRADRKHRAVEAGIDVLDPLAHNFHLKRHSVHDQGLRVVRHGFHATRTTASFAVTLVAEQP